MPSEALFKARSIAEATRVLPRPENWKAMTASRHQSGGRRFPIVSKIKTLRRSQRLCFDRRKRVVKDNRWPGSQEDFPFDKERKHKTP